MYRMSMEAAELAQSALRFLNLFFCVFGCRWKCDGLPSTTVISAARQPA